MSDTVRDRMNRYLAGAGTGKQINRIEDIAALSDGEIKQVANKYSDVQTGTNAKLEQDLLNYREKASEILGKEGTAQEDVFVTAFQKKETTQSSWSLGLKDKKLDDEYKALYSADNLQSVVPEKKGDIGKLQTAAQRTIGRPLDTMDDFKSLTNDEIKKLSENVPSVKHGDIVGYRIQATKEMDKLSSVRQTYDELGTKDYTDLVKLQQQRASDLASTADEFTKLARKQGRTADEEQQLGKLSAKIEEQRSVLQSTTEAIDARKLQMGQQKTKQLTAADIKPGVKDRKTAALNAIDAAKKGDYETAIKKFAEARTHDGRSVLSKVDAKHYDGMSINKINRMEDAVPADQMSKGMKEMLERMRQERRDFAIDALSKKGDDFKRAAFKIKNGDELDELERLKLWNSGDEIRALAKDAMDTGNTNKLLDGLVADAMKSGDEVRKAKLAESLKKDLADCIKRGDCGTGGGIGAAAGIVAGVAAIGVGANIASGEWVEDGTGIYGQIWVEPAIEIPEEDLAILEEMSAPEEVTEFARAVNLDATVKTPLGDVDLSYYGIGDYFNDITDKNERAELASYLASIEKNKNSMPDYKEGEFQCIQQFEYLKDAWERDLRINDPEHIGWLDDLRMVTAEQEWHAMAALSPGGKFTIPEKTHIIDPAYADYRGTIDQYDNDESKLQIFTDYAMKKGLDKEGGEIIRNEEATTTIRPTGSVITMTPGTTSDKVTDNTVERLVRAPILATGMVDQISRQPISPDKGYWQSKTSPSKVYTNETYNLKLNDRERSNMIYIKPE